MNWTHYIDIIDGVINGVRDTEMQQMDKRLKQGIRVDPIGSIRQERCQRRNVDIAVKFWVEHGCWPLVSPEVAGLMVLRFRSASAFLHDLQPIQPSCRAAEKRVLTWLLVKRWQLYGRPYWLCYMFGEDWPA